jgi:hypothetical protein
MPKRDLFRMIDWLVWAVVAYAICFTLRAYDLEPQAQTVLWKLGNVTVAAYVGYWIDRQAFRARITIGSTPIEGLRRAVVMAATMLTVGLGL